MSTIPRYIWTRAGMREVGDGTGIYVGLKDWERTDRLMREALKANEELNDAIELKNEQIEALRRAGTDLYHDRRHLTRLREAWEKASADVPRSPRKKVIERRRNEG